MRELLKHFASAGLGNICGAISILASLFLCNRAPSIHRFPQPWKLINLRPWSELIMGKRDVHRGWDSSIEKHDSIICFVFFLLLFLFFFFSFLHLIWDSIEELDSMEWFRWTRLKGILSSSGHENNDRISRIQLRRNGSHRDTINYRLEN